MGIFKGESSFQVRWPALELELLLTKAQLQEQHPQKQGELFQQIEELLEEFLYFKDRLPPFPIDLLDAVKSAAQHANQQPLLKCAKDCLRRLRFFYPFVVLAVHQLIQPYGGTSHQAFKTLEADFKNRLTQTISDRTKRKRAQLEWFEGRTTLGTSSWVLGPQTDWSARMQWPFAQPPTGSAPKGASPKMFRKGRDTNTLVGGSTGLETAPGFASKVLASPTHPDHAIRREVDLFWYRWSRILDTAPALFPIRALIEDQLRRALSWHVLLVPTGRLGVSLPLPIFPARITGVGPDIAYVGLEDGSLSLQDDFRQEVWRAFRAATDTWIARNRTWQPRGTTSGTDIEDLFQSTLILDFRWASQAWEAIHPEGVPELALSDHSAGMAIAIGVINLLNGSIPNAAVWATGSIRELIPDHYERTYHDRYQTPLSNDAVVGWPAMRDASSINRLAEVLTNKFLAVRAHGTAQRVIFPEQGADLSLHHFSKAVKRFAKNASQTDETEGAIALSVHPVTVARLSNAADAAVPTTYRKYRYVLFPSLRWAFSIYQSSSRTRGHFPQLPPQKPEGEALLRQLREEPLCFVVGPALSGKSYAIANALTCARLLLTQKKRRTGPRVTFVDGRTLSRSTFEFWNMLLQHLNFPADAIQRFLYTGDPNTAAALFVQNFRAHGPDVLILSGMDGIFSLEESLPTPTVLAQAPIRLLEAIARRLSKHPVRRERVVAGVLGVLEIVVECETAPRKRHPFLGVPIIAPPVFSWTVEKRRVPNAWGAVRKRILRDSNKKRIGKRFAILGMLSSMRAGVGSDFIYLVCKVAQCSPDALQWFMQHHLFFNDNHFRLGPSNGHSSGTDTGPLLREGQGHFHVHPLIKTAAYEDYIQNERHKGPRKGLFNRIELARFHHTIATTILCPFLQPHQFLRLATLNALLPEQLLEAESHLRKARSFIKADRRNPQAGVMLADIEWTRLRLERYFRRSSIGQAQRMSTLKLPNATVLRQQWTAYCHLENFLSQYTGPPHPLWLSRLGRIAAAMDPSEVPPGTPSPAGLLVISYQRAFQAMSTLASGERDYVHRSISGYFIFFILTQLKSAVKARKLTLPAGFRLQQGALFGSEIEATWKIISHFPGKLPLAYRHNDPIPASAYCAVGDEYWLTGRRGTACSIYTKGFQRMQKCIPERRWSDLLVRAVGAVYELHGEQQARELGVSNTEWVEESRYLRHRQAPHIRTFIANGDELWSRQEK